MDKENEHFLSASHQKCILLSGTECHIINYLLTELARDVPGNIGPRSFLYGPRCARSVLSRPRANIPQYDPSRSVSKRLILSQPNWGYCVYYPSVLKIGEYPRIFSSFNWGMFTHVTRLDQSRASENIWWIINKDSPIHRLIEIHGTLCIRHKGSSSHQL